MAVPAVAAAPDAGLIVVGQARFTVCTPQCVRLEYDRAGHFIDAPSYFAADRSARWPGAKVTTEGGSTIIDTGALRLTYTPDGQPFDADNLKAVIHVGGRDVDWHAGQPNAENLGGTERTLDGWDGARQLSNGLLSRDGWYLLDDSRSVLLTGEWAKPRPADAGTDWSGAFGRNETPYGHPAATVDRTFVPADLAVTVAGRRFTPSGPPVPVDFAHRAGHVAPAAHVTVSCGGRQRRWSTAAWAATPATAARSGPPTPRTPGLGHGYSGTPRSRSTDRSCSTAPTPTTR